MEPIAPHGLGATRWHSLRDRSGRSGRAAGRERVQERGFALLIVLWTTALLSVFIVGLAATGRREVKLAESQREAAMAEADGAIYRAIFRLVEQFPIRLRQPAAYRVRNQRRQSSAGIRQT
jgi:type II secretory pathway component PulK